MQEAMICNGSQNTKVNKTVMYKNSNCKAEENCRDKSDVKINVSPTFESCSTTTPTLPKERDGLSKAMKCLEAVESTVDADTIDCPSVPPDNWTRLGRLTRTRPIVDNLTTSRYSPGEWHLRNNVLLSDSKDLVRDAKNLQFKTTCTEKQICGQVDRDQHDTNLSLRDRAELLFCWKVELEKNNEEITMEIDKIQNELKRLLRCKQAVELIESMDKNIKNIRNMRMEPDLVHDSLSEEIVQEEVLCSEILNLYTRLVDEVKMQLQELKDAKQRLEYDWSDKTVAYQIDTTCIELRSESPVIQWHPGSVNLPQNQSTLESHEKFVKETLALCQTAVGRSRVLRENIKEMVNKAVKDLRNQADRIDQVHAEKIDEEVEACRALEKSLTQCLQILADNETLVWKTSKAVGRLDGPMKCAQSRLNMRLTRGNVEHCRDDPHFGLIDEVKGISEGATALSGQIKSIEDSTEALTRSRQKIEKDIIVKRKSLWVDRDRCLLMRSFYPPEKSLSGFM